jgi:tetrahydromethanopterin S-methyltransferase subunit B
MVANLSPLLLQEITVMKALINSLTFITTLFMTACAGFNDNHPHPFFFGLFIIGLLMLLISAVRMIFKGFIYKEISFFVIGAILFLIA